MLKGAVKASSGSGSVKDLASGGIASLGRVADGIEGHAIDDSLATEKVLWVPFRANVIRFALRKLARASRWRLAGKRP